MDFNGVRFLIQPKVITLLDCFKSIGRIWENMINLFLTLSFLISPNLYASFSSSAYGLMKACFQALRITNTGHTRVFDEIAKNLRTSDRGIFVEVNLLTNNKMEDGSFRTGTLDHIDKLREKGIYISGAGMQDTNWTTAYRGFYIESVEEFDLIKTELLRGPSSISKVKIVNSQGSGASDKSSSFLRDFLTLKYSHLGPKNIKATVAYAADAVFRDPEFIKDPERYLTTWTNIRGRLQIFIGTYDPIHSFLQFLHSQGKLVEFAASLSSDAKSSASTAPLSSDWQLVRDSLPHE